MNMILPDAVDSQIPFGQAFLDKPELFDHAARALVARHDVGLDPMQLQLVEGKGDRAPQGLGDQPLVDLALVELIPQMAGLERTMNDIVEGDVTDRHLKTKIRLLEQPESQHSA